MRGTTVLIYHKNYPSFYNISIILYQLVLLVEESGPRENHIATTSCLQTFVK
jgi:hypothetical protein